MILLVRVLTPSVRPLWGGVVRPASTAARSAVGEGVQVGQVGGTDVVDPLRECGVVAWSRGEEFGELPD